MMKFGPDRWTLTPEPRPDASVRLLCFPHAGGGAFGFRPWARALRSDIEIVAVQLPGRENRQSEPPLRSAEAVLDGLLAALSETLEAPYAVFGHSFGAVFAYLLACRVRRTGEAPQPIRLFLSSASPPRMEAAASKVQARRPLSDEALVKQLTQLGGTPSAILQDPTLLSAFLPAIRADFEILAGVRAESGPPFNTPFTLLRGEQDQGLDLEGFAAWRALSIRPAEEYVLPGGHFYPQTSLPALLGIIADALVRG